MSKNTPATMPDSPCPSIAAAERRRQLALICAVGFGDLGHRADALANRLRELGAEQQEISRCDRVAFSAKIGEQNAKQILGDIWTSFQWP